MANISNYSDQYVETIFFMWYENGRKLTTALANSFPPSPSGDTPSIQTVQEWKRKYGWIERADALDADLSTRLQEEVIEKRIQMYEKHTKIADALIEKGEAYLMEHQLDSSSDAIKMIDLGIEIQRVSVGQVELGRKILTMTDSQLDRELLKLIGKPETPDDEFIVDADTIEEDSEEPKDG